MNKDSRILVTGSSGLVGHAVVKLLNAKGYTNLRLTYKEDKDLTIQQNAIDLFNEFNPEYVIHLAAKVGGIMANIKQPADFTYENLMMECNVIEECRKHNSKLLFIGSVCIYPTECRQPIVEEDLLTGKPEESNEGYAIAKIAGVKLCDYYNKQYGTNFICLMPCNIYGEHDYFNTEKSHVIPAIIRKIHQAKMTNEPHVDMWGTGIARREFIFVDDIAEAILFFIENYNAKDIYPFINAGSGKDISIKELAELIKEIVGYEGEIVFDRINPDGMLKRLMDCSRADIYGWTAKTELKEGLKKTYEWYLNNE